MDTAVKVLIVGGTLNVAASFLIGMALARRRRSAPVDAHRFLLVAHEGALFEGIMLLALTLALGLSDLSSGLETLAAWLLVAASVFSVASALTNWRTGTQDQFAERSPGLKLAVVNATLATGGIGIIVVGVLTGL